METAAASPILRAVVATNVILATMDFPTVNNVRVISVELHRTFVIKHHLDVFAKKMLKQQDVPNANKVRSI
jgi:hypothetical protein